jgi:hypothetical protein
MDQYRVQHSGVQRNNASAEIFDALIRKCGPDAFSREGSKSRNVANWMERAVANWMERFMVRIVCSIIFIWKNIIVSHKPFSDLLSFLCRGGDFYFDFFSEVCCL